MYNIPTARSEFLGARLSALAGPDFVDSESPEQLNSSCIEEAVQHTVAIQDQIPWLYSVNI